MDGQPMEYLIVYDLVQEVSVVNNDTKNKRFVSYYCDFILVISGLKMFLITPPLCAFL